MGLVGAVKRWLCRKRESVDAYPKWPSMTLFCVRHPLEHPAWTKPYDRYPVASHSGVLGPVRSERCRECGALMYVGAVNVIAARSGEL